MAEDGFFLEDDKIAVQCYRLIAEQRDTRSQSNLGVIYANEDGVIQDNVYAHMGTELPNHLGTTSESSTETVLRRK